MAKTATGVFAASVAKESYQNRAMHLESPIERLAVKAVGSVLAAIAFHCLKEDEEAVANSLCHRRSETRWGA